MALNARLVIAGIIRFHGGSDHEHLAHLDRISERLVNISPSLHRQPGRDLGFAAVGRPCIYSGLEFCKLWQRTRSKRAFGARLLALADWMAPIRDRPAQSRPAFFGRCFT